MQNRTYWRVVFWRIGSGCGQYGEGRTLERAYQDAIKRAGGASAPYLTGLSGSNGERFGRDLSEAFRAHFESAAKLIRSNGRRGLPCPRASSAETGACVEIIRNPTASDNFLARNYAA